MIINRFPWRHFIMTLLFLALPVIVHAQYTFITNANFAVTITGYNGPGGAVIIPTRLNGFLVNRIGDEAFANATNLNSVSLSNLWSGGNSIGVQAFMGCTGLTNVIINYAITNIGNLAFADCTSLAAVYFSGSPPADNGTAFSGDPNAVIYYPPGTPGWGPTFGSAPAVAQTPAYDFGYSVNNDSLTLTVYGGPKGAVIIPPFINGYPVTSIGNGFDAHDSATTVTIPNTVTNIGIFAFENSGSLTNVTLPDSVTTIGMAAFFQSGLTAITIPESVTTIGPNAFEDCMNLKSAWFLGNAPPNNSTIFAFDSSATVYNLPGTTGWTNTFGSAPTALWYQPQPTVLNFEPSFGVQNNQFGFTISWATNASVIVRACTNLANPDWIPVATNTLTSGTNYFSDPQWVNYPNRFYRVSGP